MGEFLERYRTQRELAEREESYRVLTATAPDGIITIDAEGTILFANAAAARIFGYSREELTGCNAAILLPEPAAGRSKLLSRVTSKAVSGRDRGGPFR